MSENAQHPRKHSLTVLPHSGKVDQLRREIMADAQTPAESEPREAPTPARPPSSQGGDAAATAPAPTPIELKLIEAKVIEALRTIYDPEIPVDIYDLGLIYDIQVDPTRAVNVKMTLTAPACPVAGTLPGEVEKKIENIPEVRTANVELVWDPPWDRSRMSEAAMLQLGF